MAHACDNGKHEDLHEQKKITFLHYSIVGKLEGNGPVESAASRAIEDKH